VDVYTTEEEQIAAIKKWWKDNWMSLAGGILIGVGILSGYKYWVNSKNLHAEAASAEYEAMILSLKGNKPEEVSARAASLLGQYSDTPYAGFAALAMAKIKVDSKELVAAKSNLRWAIDNVKQPEIKIEAQIRLARVLLAEENYDEALQQLQSISAKAYKAVVEELKGDIYVAQGETAKARTAYNIALSELSLNQSGTSQRLRNNLQIKLDDLGEVASPVKEAG